MFEIFKYILKACMASHVNIIIKAYMATHTMYFTKKKPLWHPIPWYLKSHTLHSMIIKKPICILLIPSMFDIIGFKYFGLQILDN